METEIGDGPLPEIDNYVKNGKFYGFYTQFLLNFLIFARGGGANSYKIFTGDGIKNKLKDNF